MGQWTQEWQIHTDSRCVFIHVTTIELAQDRQVVNARQVCVLPSCFSSLSRNRPLSRSLPSHSFFSRFCLTERSERSPRELVYFPIERRSTERARDGYLRRASQTDRSDVIESRYFIVCAFELRVLALLTRTDLLRTSTSLRAWRLENYMPCDVWILRRVQFLLLVGASCEVQAKREFSFNLSLGALFERTRDRISFKSDETKVYKRYDWQLSLIGINAKQSLFISLNFYFDI